MRLAALLTILAPAPALAQTPAGDVSAVPGRDAALIELGRAIHTAAQREDTGHAVFHGCYDWHSAVHAHWALLRVARVTGQTEALAAWVEAQL